MKYLLDGYNIIFRRSFGASSLEEVRTQFIQELDRVARALHLKITVVLDAYTREEGEKRHHYHSLEIIYTSKNMTADECILHYLHRFTEKERRQITVVTSDRPLQKQARFEQANTLSVSAFFHFMKAKILKKYPPTLTPLPKQEKKSHLPPLTDTQAWIALFERSSN